MCSYEMLRLNGEWGAETSQQGSSCTENRLRTGLGEQDRCPYLASQEDEPEGQRHLRGLCCPALPARAEAGGFGLL